MATQPAQLQSHHSFQLSRYLPFIDWLFNYKRENLSGDLIAGVIVAVMLVPQSMAYALLAGLPPEVGLYSSIVPLILYGLLGTSSVLAVGPVAMISLLVATGIGQLSPANTAEYIGMALVLALQVAIIQMVMGILRIGFLVNFLSHPVLSGFTSAAAIVIGFSQLKSVLGISMPRTEHFYENIFYAVGRIDQINIATLVIALLSIGTLFFFKFKVGGYLKQLDIPEAIRMPLAKSGPLFIVIMGTLTVMIFNLDETAAVSIVGMVPAGLPALTIPSFDMNLWVDLFPVALTISLVGFMESISVAKSLASKKRQKVHADQELIALGAANLGAAFTGGYPVTGGLSRTGVNYSAGANTGMASLITAGLIALTVLLLTPLFYHLPSAALAAIIIVAVTGLFDYKTFRHAWRYDRADGISMLVTFFGVLFIGIEPGILIGAATSLGLYLYRTSRPHTAIVGRVGDSEHFRNVLRHEVKTYSGLLLVRVDESLYFPNMTYLEEELLGAVADDPSINHLVLICSAVNFIDTSALESLENLKHELDDAGVNLYMAEVKGPVMDRLKKIGFADEIGEENIFLSTHQAVVALTQS